MVAHTSTVRAPLFLRSPYTDIEPTGDFELINASSEKQSKALVAAIASVSSQTPEGPKDYEALLGIQEACGSDKLEALI
jgi:hypothetical protein